MKAEGGMGLLTSFGTQSSDGNEGKIDDAVEKAIAETGEENNDAAVVTTPEAEAEETAEAAPVDIEAMVAETEAEEAAEAAPVDIEVLVAEAEARGYERGRNEGIEAWMHGGRPEASNGSTACDNDPYESEVMILNNMRPSIWEQI